MPEADTWARWEGQDRNRRSIEIDMVARTVDGRMITSEFKWSSRAVTAEVHSQLIRNLEDLAASGFGWAKQALNAETSAGHVYISAAGFSDSFRRQAESDGRIRLLSLEDLYRTAETPS